MDIPYRWFLGAVSAYNKGVGRCLLRDVDAVPFLVLLFLCGACPHATKFGNMKTSKPQPTTETVPKYLYDALLQANAALRESYKNALQVLYERLDALEGRVEKVSPKESGPKSSNVIPFIPSKMTSKVVD